MFSSGRLRTIRYPARSERVLNKISPFLFAGLTAIVILHGLALIPLSNGGGDLVSADIPKSLMVLRGQDPYAVQPWASPYPPLLLLVDSGIIKLSGSITNQSSVDLVSQNIRVAGLLADGMVGVIVYLYLRGKTSNPLVPLVSAGLFLTLPALSISPLYFFHSDVFGYPILALSLVALATSRYLIGTSLLAVAAIFKIHPLLAVLLSLVWLARSRSLRSSLPSLICGVVILGFGLVLPLEIPGYAQSILGFNLSNQGSGSTFSATANLANSVLPQQFQIIPTPILANQVWIASTLALYTIVVAIVWTRARSFTSVDVVLLGLLAWLIPLKIEYTHYLAWAMVPVLLRGRILQSIPMLGLLQAADTLSYWSWWPNTSPIPGLVTNDGLAVASTIYRIIGLVAFGCVILTLRNNRRIRSPISEETPGLRDPREVKSLVVPA